MAAALDLFGSAIPAAAPKLGREAARDRAPRAVSPAALDVSSLDCAAWSGSPAPAAAFSGSPSSLSADFGLAPPKPVVEAVSPASPKLLGMPPIEAVRAACAAHRGEALGCAGTPCECRYPDPGSALMPCHVAIMRAGGPAVQRRTTDAARRAIAMLDAASPQEALRFLVEHAGHLVGAVALLRHGFLPEAHYHLACLQRG